MASLEISDIKRIAQLLKQGEDSSSDSEDDAANNGRASLASAGPGHLTASRGEVAATNTATAAEDPLAIWRSEELDEAAGYEDPRQRPEYQLLYRQSVGAEDVFLQLGAKTPASASCETLVVKVALPGDSRDQVHLQVTRTQLEVLSARHCLRLPLPHPVDADSAEASWQPHDHTLVVAVKMDRELDFLNM